MNFLILMIAILYNCQYLIRSQVEYACNPRYCPAFGNCPKFHCKGGNMKPILNATKCGCCHKCVIELEENDECQSEMTGNLPGTQCGPHLYCQKDEKIGKSVCVSLAQKPDNTCEREKNSLSKRTSEVTTGRPIPECDEFGDYGAKQCKNGTLCHCVDKKGNRIFGTSIYSDSKNMDCLCSRQFDEVNRHLSDLEFSIDPVFYQRCKANGNYEPFQTNGNMTYCVNVTSGELHDRPVHKRDSDQLPCNKYRYPYNSECMTNYTRVMKEIENLENLEGENQIVVGYDVPKCDIDGTFAAVQCMNSHCYCVNKKGEKYRGTQVDRNEPFFASRQRCNCVRELELIRDISGKHRDKVTELFSDYKCDKNGNYLPLQCSESVCYTVDDTYGYQVSKSILKTDKNKILQLIKEYPDINKYPDSERYPESDFNRIFRIYKNEFL
jgi:hypothetical protein